MSCMKHTAPTGSDPMDILLRRAMAEGCGDRDVAWFDSLDTSGVTLDRAYRRKRSRIIYGETRPVTVRFRRQIYIACLMAILSCLLATVALTVSASRENWRDWVSWGDDGLYISIISPEEPIGTYSVDETEGETPSSPAFLEEFRKPRYTPEGVREEILVQNTANHTVLYERDGLFLYEYRQMLPDGDVLNRHVESASLTPVNINGNAAVLADREDGYLSLIWHDGEYVYELTAAVRLTREELLLVAQSVVTPDPINLQHRYHLLSFRKPLVLPEGIREQIVVQNEDAHIIVYLEGETEVARFEQTLLDDVGEYARDGVSLADILIGDAEGVLLSYRDGSCGIIWSDGEYQYRLFAEDGAYREMIFAMAESMPALK